MSLWRLLKYKLAANLLDAPRYALVLRWPGLGRRFGRTWVDLRNRHERLVRQPDQRGVRCDWLWTSALFYCQAYPQVGQQLLARALADWAIEFRAAPSVKATGEPQVSFIIGHRGTERIPHLLATLASLAGQVDTSIECMVVEQATTPVLANVLPGWVRHLHTPPPWPEMPYSRSWAFNAGARAARGRYLVFHDNDICVPARYAAELLAVFQRGFQAARLMRFLFYLDEADTRALFTSHHLLPTPPPLGVVQNCEGGTLAVERDFYFELGGHDEGFLGWGGEDNELFDRLRTGRLHDHAYLPFVHLYHATQPGKTVGPPNQDYFQARMRIPATRRVAELSQRPFGSPAGPSLPCSPESNLHGHSNRCDVADAVN
jgi:hypothetical protein